MDHDTCTARIDGLLDQALNLRTERAAAHQEVAGLLTALADRDRLIGQLKDQVADLRGMLAMTKATP